MYASGMGVPYNNQEALKYFLLAANQGHVNAQIRLRELYQQGRGTPKNYQP